MMELTPADRKALKARAHSLEPVVTLGGKGLTEQVFAEIGRALAAHGLIKISARGLERIERDAALTRICERTSAQPVQHIGKVLVIYREKPDEPVPEPGVKPRRASRSTRLGPRGTARHRGSAPPPSRRPVRR